MNKLLHDTDNTELLREVGRLVTLVETEKHIKSAASSAVTREMLRDCKPDNDHFLMHVVALGDHEHYSFNRNADSFPKEACQKYHDTFVKNAHLFREHNHDDPKKAIGIVKASAYNEEMGRVELAVWGNKKLAAEEWDKVKTERPITVSMGCSVDWDRDSITGKKCASPQQYEDWMRNRPGQYIPEHKKFAFVYNDHPKFFDISVVKKPADRIAYYLQYVDSNTKVATLNEKDIVIPGALLATAAGLIDNGLSSESEIIAKKLANVEREYWDILADSNASSPDATWVKHAAVNAWLEDENLSQSFLDSVREIRPGTFFNKLAKKKIILPFESFLSYANNKPLTSIQDNPVVKYAKKMLMPTAFTEFMMNPMSVMPFMGFDDDEYTDFNCGDNIDRLMDSVANRFSIDDSEEKQKPLQKRIISITITSSSPSKLNKKTASFNLSKEQIDEAHQYTRSYAAYKVAAVQRINQKCKNKLDRKHLFLLVSQNNI